MRTKKMLTEKIKTNEEIHKKRLVARKKCIKIEKTTNNESLSSKASTKHIPLKN